MRGGRIVGNIPKSGWVKTLGSKQRTTPDLTSMPTYPSDVGEEAADIREEEEEAGDGGCIGDGVESVGVEVFGSRGAPEPLRNKEDGNRSVMVGNWQLRNDKG